MDVNAGYIGQSCVSRAQECHLVTNVVVFLNAAARLSCMVVSVTTTVPVVFFPRWKTRCFLKTPKQLKDTSECALFVLDRSDDIFRLG